MVKISIIMPVYNASKYIENAVLSVYNQTLKDVELICVNDGSTDNSLEILEKLEKEYNFIKIYNQENQGSGKARNTGISKATGEYIAFLDADDVYLDNNALEKMYFIGNKNNADMVGANLKRINLDGSIDKRYDFKNTDFKYFDQTEVVLPVDYGIPFAFYRNIFKKELIDKHEIVFPDLLRGQDPIFLATVLVNIDEIYATNADLYGYNNKVAGGVNKKVNNYSKKYDYIQHFKNTFDILKEHEFYNSLEGYKKEFLKYLTFEDNLIDEDIKDILPRVFPNINDYYDENDFGYPYVEMAMNNNPEEVEKINQELDDFRTIKECLFRETLLNDNFIDARYLRKYVQIKTENTDKNKELEQLSFQALKETEKNVTRRTQLLETEVEQLREDVAEIKESTDAVLSSKSWNITETLRTLKHIFNK